MTHRCCGLASLAYSDNDADVPPGWEVVERFDYPSGLQAVLVRDAHGNMVLAVRGSAGPGLNMEAANDWSNDSLGATGTSRPQAQAIALALALQAKYPGAERLAFTGHSLGGELASLASLATGNKAVTFDPAGISTEAIIRALITGITYRLAIAPGLPANRYLVEFPSSVI